MFESLSFLGDEVPPTTFMLVFGWIGNALALFFFFSPAIKMWALIKEKIEYTSISYVMFIANVMNCILWAVYGIFKKKLEIWICNSIGGITNTIYLLIFFFFFADKMILKYALYFILNIGVLSGIFLVYYNFAGEDFTGKSAMIFNIIMYAAPGQKIVKYN
jgi:uncharacterized protein with PQ loop repeat